ncbi:MAG: hypothetical protein MUO53_14270 [Maribacter sp.]|nr:hypothetical protein [Maribacter sp.]
MLEFLKENFFMPLYLLALVIALYRYRLYYDGLLCNFPILIAYTLLSEILGYLIYTFDNFHIVDSELYPYANNFVFNIYDIVFFLYFYYIFWKIVNEVKYKNLILYGAILYIMAVCINAIYQDAIIFPQVFASTIGSIILVISIFLFFIKAKSIHVKEKNVLIWISSGLLIFHLFFPPILIAGHFYYDLYQSLHLRQVHYLLIVAMYACIIIGFLKMRPVKPIMRRD